LKRLIQDLVFVFGLALAAQLIGIEGGSELLGQ
jgi:hypothetical protein